MLAPKFWIAEVRGADVSVRTYQALVSCDAETVFASVSFSARVPVITVRVHLGGEAAPKLITCIQSAGICIITIHNNGAGLTKPSLTEIS
jgi:hypothetical protein